MVKCGDKIILKKEMGAFKNIGEECEITSVNDGIISFKFGNGMHLGCMSEDELTKYFTVKGEAPTVTKEVIEDIILNSEVKIETVYDKCTVVTVKLPNGFIISESSACVSPENYNESLGYEICMQKIKSKVWELEGYVLQKKIYEENSSVQYDW